jgi:hypothetical protein
VTESSTELKSLPVSIIAGPCERYYCKIMNVVIFMRANVAVDCIGDSLSLSLVLQPSLGRGLLHYFLPFIPFCNADCDINFNT